MIFTLLFVLFFFHQEKALLKRGENSGFCFVFLFSAAGFWELRGAAWCGVAWAAPAGAARMCHPCKSGSCAPGSTPNVLLSMQILPPRQRRRQSAISSGNRLQNTKTRPLAVSRITAGLTSQRFIFCADFYIYLFVFLPSVPVHHSTGDGDLFMLMGFVTPGR